MQEREETIRMVQLINHKDDGQFVINMTGLHNAAQIRKILPRHLTAPKPLHTDRQAYHFEIAAKLRITQAQKREQTKAKAKATREANKAKKKSREIAMQTRRDEGVESEIDDSDMESDSGDGDAAIITQRGSKRQRVMN
jgi:hypothetical protein